MARLSMIICWLLLAVLLSGCTIHFKATELELDAKTKDVEVNRTYELEKVDFLVRTNRGS